MKYYIETYGCQMNKAESSSLIEKMNSNGFLQVSSPEASDVVIVNTCSVRKTAESRIWGRLGLFKRHKRSKNIIVLVMGCMPQRIGEEIINSKHNVDIVVGNFYKNSIPEIIKNHRRGEKSVFIDEKSVVFDTPSQDCDNPAKAFVTISHGCNNFCTYCIVPYLRGREVSKDPDLIIDDIKRLTDLGVKQVTLLGQNVNSYGDGSIRFPQLLKRICRETGIMWIKFLSSHPKDFSEELIDVIAEEDKMSKWLHLALQSGSDKILESMNRKYTRRDFIDKVTMYRERVRDAIITTDLIIGFPGETDSDYNDTLNLIKDIEFDDGYLYKYNTRENTSAYINLKDDVDEIVKGERLSHLIDIQRAINVRKKREKIGRIYDILIENEAKDSSGKFFGVSREELRFVCEADNVKQGDIIRVKANGLSGTTFHSEMVKDE